MSSEKDTPQVGGGSEKASKSSAIEDANPTADGGATTRSNDQMNPQKDVARDVEGEGGAATENTDGDHRGNAEMDTELDTNGAIKTTTNTDGGSETLPRDDIFEILRNRRRRLTLQYLNNTEGDQVPMSEVVDYVTSHESGCSIDEIDSGKRKAVYTALRQTHFPKMDDLGVVDYDKLRGDVELTDAADDARLYLEYVPEDEIPWHEYYLGLTAVSAALFAVVWAGVPPFDRLSWLVLAVTYVVLFGTSAVVHTVQARNTRIDYEDPI